MALDEAPVVPPPDFSVAASGAPASGGDGAVTASGSRPDLSTLSSNGRFTSKTRAIIYGMQPRAVQGMLDFDYISQRSKPSVAAMIFPFAGNHYQKFYWGTDEVLIPVYKDMSEALRKCVVIVVVVVVKVASRVVGLHYCCIFLKSSCASS